MQIEPLGLALMAIGCFGWLYAGDMKRRAASANVKRRSVVDRRLAEAGIRGGCDAEPSPPTTDYRYPDPKDQDRAYPLAGGRSASRSGASSFLPGRR